MSDYTSTFTEGTGDTIDATDFSTEFNAIETAIASKADASGDAISVNAGDLTIASKTAYGMVILDEPEQLVNITTEPAAGWTQYDMSAGGTEAAAAAAANAVKAILRVTVSGTDSSGGSSIYGSVQKNGLGGALSTGKYAVFSLGSASGDEAYSWNDVIVNLDSNSDFEYDYEQTTFSSSAFRIYLLGYFV